MAKVSIFKEDLMREILNHLKESVSGLDKLAYRDLLWRALGELDALKLAFYTVAIKGEYTDEAVSIIKEFDEVNDKGRAIINQKFENLSLNQ